ncbi:MAG: Crp/Fnr family transcriptional regulator [Sandarakinorhabdus sp.]|jgi:CRP-like cAMP-binding protein|nr:Crp/Fnr family transcriptional regulator [Sandarakinorhabdus sp.]
MNRAQAEAVLITHGWLADAPAGLRRRVLDACHVRQVAAGQSIYQFDDEPAGILGLASGRLAMHLAAGPDDPTLFAHVTPGYWLADLALPPGAPRPVSAMAIEPSVLLRLPGNDVRALGAQDPELALLFSLLININFGTTLAMMAVLRRVDLVERLAAMLCVLAGQDLADGWLIRVTQSQLAAMIVAGRTSLVDSLKALEQRGLVAGVYGGVRVLDAAGLMAAARYTA